MAIHTAATIDIDAPLDHAFETAVSISPCALIKPHGPLPGITDGEGHETPWRSPGQTRRHLLSDGSSVDEELIRYAANDSFAYRVTGFSGPFGALVRDAIGEWRFKASAPNIAQIEWRYAFTPTSPLTALALWLIVKSLWPGYLKAALQRVKDRAELGDG